MPINNNTYPNLPQGGYHKRYEQLGLERGSTSNFHCINEAAHSGGHDNKPSLSIKDETGQYFCHACGIKGNLITFSKEFPEYFKSQSVWEFLGIPSKNHHSIAAKVQTSKIINPKTVTNIAPTSPSFITFEEEEITNAPLKHRRYGEPQRVYPYYNAKGSIDFIVTRYEDSDKNKSFFSLHKNVDNQWVKKGIHDKGYQKPLFNLLDLLTADENTPVLLVEGEKACEKGVELLSSFYTCCTWSGGANALGRTDFSPLSGHEVILWPDNDVPGTKAMDKLAAELQTEYSCRVSIVSVPKCFKEKDDLADAESRGMTSDMVLKHIEENSVLVEVDNVETPLPPFKILGIREQTLFFQKPDGAIYRFSTEKLRMSNLFLLASKIELETLVRGDSMEKTTVKVEDIQEYLISEALKLEPFAPENVRGTGIWQDGSRVVLNTGRTLKIYHFNEEGSFSHTVESAIGTFESFFVYEATDRILPEYGGLPVNEETALEISKFLCTYLRWENSNAGILLLGWIVAAFIPGLLKWRPHIYITGSAGSGKTDIAELMLRAILGLSLLSVSSSTTEAGIRQALGSSAISISMDEAEAEDAKGALRVQAILELAREGASNTGFAILKGTSGGKAQQFLANFLLCMLSIGKPLVQSADISRFAVLELVSKSKFQSQCDTSDYRAKVKALFSEEQCPAFRERVLHLIPTLMYNIPLFVDCIAALTDSNRDGDVHGTLHAAAFTFVSGRKATSVDIQSWIETYKPEELICTQQAPKDEEICLQRILEHTIRCSGEMGFVERSISELANIAMASIGENDQQSAAFKDGIKGVDALNTLKRYGLKVIKEKGEAEYYLAISNTAKPLKDILKDTPWQNNWNNILKRLPNSVTVESTYFSKGIKSRAVKIPLEDIFGNDVSTDHVDTVEYF